MHRHHHWGHHWGCEGRGRDDMGGGGWPDHRLGRGFGRHGWGGGRGEHRGGGGRVFDQGDLRLVILRLIADKPAHGYEIIKAIEEKLGGAYSPSPGVVYPTLTLLEELGYVTVAPEANGKKLYTVTPEGEAFLAENQASVDAIFARIEEVGRRGGASPQIVRAMENLRTALKLKLGRGQVSEEQIRAIAEALDQAALAVERS